MEEIAPGIVFDVNPRPALRANKTTANLLRMPDSKLAQEGLARKRRIQATYEYYDNIRAIALEHGFELPDILNIIFFMPMPKSWSEKEKKKMEGTEHQQTPDLDNLIKGFKDALSYSKVKSEKKNDSHVWCYLLQAKVWSRTGYIYVINPKKENNGRDQVLETVQQIQEYRHGLSGTSS
jgi:Holliday junction resolvase RusA-like endonuclease